MTLKQEVFKIREIPKIEQVNFYQDKVIGTARLMSGTGT